MRRRAVVFMAGLVESPAPSDTDQEPDLSCNGHSCAYNICLPVGCLWHDGSADALTGLLPVELEHLMGWDRGWALGADRWQARSAHYVPWQRHWRSAKGAQSMGSNNGSERADTHARPTTHTLTCSKVRLPILISRRLRGMCYV